MTQHDPRLQEAASKITEGVLLALTALAGTGAAAAASSETTKPAAKKKDAEPKAEAKKAEPEAKSEEITAAAVKKALVAAAKKHGREAVMPLLEATGEGIRTADAVPASKRAALIQELELLG